MPIIGIDSVSVQGFKSLTERGRIEIRPLTILAGANSSGKSSIMQPLLLMKQTLDASAADPGALLLDGPNVNLTSVDQFIPHDRHQELSVEVTTVHQVTYGSLFSVDAGDIRIRETSIIDDDEDARLRLADPGVYSASEFHASITRFYPDLMATLDRVFQARPCYARVQHRRCFLDVDLLSPDKKVIINSLFTDAVFDAIARLIHVPGLRGPRNRVYPQAASGATFAGSFENNVGSIIFDWASKKDDRLADLEQYLTALEMTNAVTASRVDDKFDVRIGRLPAKESGTKDLVSIADVGFGVSQVLPMLVACLIADADQLVYIEQPELHLHPKAQYELARIIAERAKQSGARFVLETHSALFLLRIQTLMAEGSLEPSMVKLHWFTRNPEGITSITSNDLNDRGAFGDWPEDFGNIELKASSAYLDAIAKRRSKS